MNKEIIDNPIDAVRYIKREVIRSGMAFRNDADIRVFWTSIFARTGQHFTVAELHLLCDVDYKLKALCHKLSFWEDIITAQHEDASWFKWFRIEDFEDDETHGAELYKAVQLWGHTFALSKSMGSDVPKSNTLYFRDRAFTLKYEPAEGNARYRDLTYIFDPASYSDGNDILKEAGKYIANHSTTTFTVHEFKTLDPRTLMSIWITLAKACLKRGHVV